MGVKTVESELVKLVAKFVFETTPDFVEDGLRMGD